MCAVLRKSTRFDDIGRVDAPQICALPGVLDNISQEGCKIHYTFPVVIDLDNDYEIRISPARTSGSSGRPFTLLCHPQWVREDKGSTEIGLSILRSKDYSRLAEYIKQLDSDAQNQDISAQISGSVCQFV